MTDGTTQRLVSEIRVRDLLIAGSTSFDSNPAALTQIVTEWSSADSYTNRVAALRTGSNGLPKLDATTVTNDQEQDRLIGGQGLDWFFGALPDLLINWVPAEQIN